MNDISAMNQWTTVTHNKCITFLTKVINSNEKWQKEQSTFGMWNNFEKWGQWIVSPLEYVHSNL